MTALHTRGTPSPAPASKIPAHVAIIMDGNGRWADQHGLPRLRGHERGTDSVREAVRTCRKLGVRYLTLYAFSVENWSRPKAEVDGLMNLLRRFLRSEEDELHQNKVRLRVIGRISDLPQSVRAELDRVMAATQGYVDGNLILALSYGARTEIAHACREIARRVQAGGLAVDAIDEQTVGQHLYAPDVPDPDLMIRTSGEMRLSNFLLWQLSYAELYVTDVLWPDFREAEFRAALEEFGRRERRFGNVE